MVPIHRTETFLTNTALPIQLYEAHGAEQMQYLHRHDCLELNYIRSGRGINYIEDQKYEMRHGELYLINHREHHMAVGTEHLCMTVLIFDPSSLWPHSADAAAYLRLFYERSDGWHNRLSLQEHEPQFVQLLSRLERAQQDARTDTLLFVRAYLMELLAYLCRWYPATALQLPAAVARHRQQVHPAMTYLQEHFTQNVTLEQLARVCCMSRTYFCSCFKEATGMTAWEYLRLVRIRHARQLISTTDLSIAEICYQCGYSNLSSFNLAFRQMCNMTPTAYRRCHRGRFEKTESITSLS